MRVLVVEYLVTCFRREVAELYRDILVEGYAMVHALSNFLTSAGLDVNISVSSDLGYSFFQLA
jgi:hypothetical protein|uniref:Uncharacterized protein n=1 Tax=Ignisphaera aggregans TaxID=334771 RepID=A0A7J2U5U5_9CREN